MGPCFRRDDDYEIYADAASRSRWRDTFRRAIHPEPGKNRYRRHRGLKTFAFPRPQDAMQVSNVRLTTAAGHRPRTLERNGRIRQPPRSGSRYSAFAFIQSATARPIAGPESSWMKCEPGTVTSFWFFQLRQNSLTAPIRMAPGSALMNSFGMSRPASHCE